MIFVACLAVNFALNSFAMLRFPSATPPPTALLLVLLFPLGLCGEFFFVGAVDEVGTIVSVFDAVVVVTRPFGVAAVVDVAAAGDVVVADFPFVVMLLLSIVDEDDVVEVVVPVVIDDVVDVDLPELADLTSAASELVTLSCLFHLVRRF